MLKIQRLGSTDISDDDVLSYCDVINNVFPSFNETITISMYDELFYYKLCIKYKNPSLPNVNSFTTSDVSVGDDLSKAIISLVSKNIEQIICTHEYERTNDPFGKTYTDGRSVCSKCNFKNKKGLPKIEGHIIQMSDSDDIVSDLKWPKDCFLQGGDSGLVLSKKESYTTSFMEAFPNVDGVGTFVRGEGSGILEAEQDCFSKYLKYVNCKDHTWTRMVHGTERTDGYGKCVSCGLTGHALEPSTTCKICSIPTKISSGDEFFCQKHYFEQNYDILLKNELDTFKESLFGMRRESDETEFSFFVEFHLGIFWYNELGKEEYEAHKSALRHTYAYFKGWIMEQYYGKTRLFMKVDYPKPDNHIVKGCMKQYILNRDKVLKFIKGECQLKKEDLIDTNLIP